MCSKDMPQQICALFNLILYAQQLDISPYLYLILLSSPRLTPTDFSFLLYPPSVRLSCVPFVGRFKFPPKLFLKQRRETFRFCQKAFSSWRRSSRGNSQMMTAIVKGQISPCGFASDCMFISFWSGRDSKPLSRSPHSPNSWSSACHWNRLIADPGDRGKVAVCHPTSVLAMKTSSAVLSFFFYSLTEWPVSFYGLFYCTVDYYNTWATLSNDYEKVCHKTSLNDTMSGILLFVDCAIFYFPQIMSC